MDWLMKLWWNVTLGCIILCKACIAYWADHLPHNPVSVEVRSDQPKPIQDIELVSYAELEQ